MQTNRALRAMAITIFGWIGLRSSFLLLSSSAEILAPLSRQSQAASFASQLITHKRLISQPAMTKRTVQNIKTKPDIRLVAAQTDKIILQEIATNQEPTRPTQSTVIGPFTQILLPVPPRASDDPLDNAHPRSRFFNPSVSAWAILRPASSGPILATNGQLGASQAGIRIQQPLFRSNERALIALNLRLSAPLDQQQGREAGIGLVTRPIKRIPVELIFERRVALDRGGRNALALIAAGGFDDKPLVSKVSLSGYAQAGMVGFARNDGFIDGALRVEQALLDRNHTGLRVGAGLWGAAQPRVTRIDVGPILAVKQRVGSANVRISAEYRWRVAGQARPASGPAISIGTDF
jgi:hypothetical protein